MLAPSFQGAFEINTVETCSSFRTSAMAIILRKISFVCGGMLVLKIGTTIKSIMSLTQ